MHLTTLSDYLGFSILWTLPLLYLSKCLALFRKPTHTPSGRLLSEAQELALQEELHSFHKKISLKRPPKILEVWNPFYSDSLDSLSRKYPPSLLIVPKLYEMDKQAFLWLYKHELAHLVYHHHFRIQLAKCCLALAGATLFHLYYGLSFALTLVINFFLLTLAQALSFYFTKKQADSFALRQCNAAELQGAHRFLEAAYNTALKSTLFEKIFVARFLLIRLKKVQRYLLARAPAEPSSLSFEPLQELLTKDHVEEERFIDSKKEKILRWIDADHED